MGLLLPIAARQVGGRLLEGSWDIAKFLAFSLVVLTVNNKPSGQI